MTWQCKNCFRWLAEFENCICQDEGYTVHVLMSDGSVQVRPGGGMQLPEQLSAGTGLMLHTVVGGSATEHLPHVGYWPHGSTLPPPHGRASPETIRRYRGHAGGQSEALTIVLPAVQDPPYVDDDGHPIVRRDQVPAGTARRFVTPDLDYSHGGNPASYDTAGHPAQQDNSGVYAQGQPDDPYNGGYSGPPDGNTAGRGVGGVPQEPVDTGIHDQEPLETNMPGPAHDYQERTHQGHHGHHGDHGQRG